MANTRSAEKRNRQTQKRRARNVTVRTGLKSAVKKARETLATGGESAAVATAIRTLAKAASKGVIPKNTASRRIGRLAKAAHAAKKAVNA